MLIPIRHENMSARRWPVITIALIALNLAIFLATQDQLQQQAPEIGEARAHILILAAMHPELKSAPETQQLVDAFRQHNPDEWAQIQEPGRRPIDAWDAHIRTLERQSELQAEMDSLSAQYLQLQSSSITEQYAFIPAHPKPIAYLTANFLHGGWLHLIGNMWFLWLAGFVLEDVWGRALYSCFYLVAGAAALQFHAWANPGSLTPTIGASGAVAALMGAFLVRFPKMKIEMIWLLGFFRSYRFKAPAYWLLPLWLLMEVLYGTLFGQASGVAHWAHVGGFAFGALTVVTLRYSGLEHKASQAVTEKVSWTAAPEIEQANDLMERGQLDQAATVLSNHLAKDPTSVDTLNLLRQALWRKGDVAAYQQATIQSCTLHLKAHEHEAAWQDYEDFLNSDAEKLPAATWLELCRVVEDQQHFDRALSEYGSLAVAYPTERQSVMAQLGAARICLKRLNRPHDALKFYEAASASLAPHLDLEQNIQSGIREAHAALAPAKASSASR